MQDVQYAYNQQQQTFNVGELIVQQAETVALVGESGSGKSTLLGLLCGVLRAQGGSIVVNNQPLPPNNPAKRDRLRADHIGYIFQSLNLLPFLSAQDNVLLGAQFSAERARRAGSSRAERADAAQALLARLGIDDAAQKAGRLSVGQQQRVAVARALFGSPALIVADEPTAALDPVNRDRFVDLVLEESRRTNAGLLVVSHDESMVGRFDRQLDLSSIAHWSDPQ